MGFAPQKNRLDPVPEAAYWITPMGPVPHTALQDFGLFLTAFFPVLSIIVCGLRFYSKYVAKRFGIDDWFIVAAVILIIPQAIFTGIYLIMGYWGIHDVDIPPRPWNQGMLWNYLNQVFYNPVLSLVKISALLFLLRVGGTKKKVNMACTVMIWFNMLQLLAFMPVVIFQCLPLEYSWRGVKTGKCITGGTFSTTLSSINVLTDILTLWIPFWAFLDLKVNKRVRNALLGVFCVGALCVLPHSKTRPIWISFDMGLSDHASQMMVNRVVAMSAVRLYYIIRQFYLEPEDRNYSLGYITNTIEINLAVLCASAPALWPLFRRWFPGMFHSLGLDRPYLYPDIEVGYATQKSRVSHLTTPTKSLKVKVSWKAHRKTPSWVDRGKSPSNASSTEDMPHAHGLSGGVPRPSDGGGGEGSGSVSPGSSTLPIQFTGNRPRGNTNTTVAEDGGGPRTQNGGNTSPRSWESFYDEEDHTDDDFSWRDESETYHGVLRPMPTREHPNHLRRDTIGQAR
ncbi:hypothetical protein V8F20_000069 [Naviculisporaceae sp. PSN 640]